MSSQQLVEVCHTGDAQSLAALLTQNPGELDVNLSSEGGVTLLMHTIIGAGTGVNPAGNYLEVCRLLIQSGAVLETPDTTYGRTAAHWAVYYHIADILVELILSAGCDMTSPDFSGMSPFHLAIEEGASNCLAEALRFVPKEIHQYPDHQGRSPIIHAIQLGSLEACQILLPSLPSPNELDPNSGRTPLHFAAETANGPIIELLLRSGCVLDLPDLSGLTPVHIAAVVDNPEGLVTIARVVGAEVLNIFDTQGMTPLMHACCYGNEGNVKFLLKKKANALVQDAEGKTCLHWCSESVYPAAAQCVQLICKKHKELVETCDNYQRAPLHACAIGGSVESLQVLLANGCEITAVDGEEHTAVHWATVSGNPTVLAAAIEAGCPLTTTDIHGNYPLHYAAQHAREPSPEEYDDAQQLKAQNVQECLRILLERGAPVDCHDGQGMEPLHWALQFPYNLQASALLLAAGGDPNAKDNEGMTGLHIASHQGLVENCQFLLEQTTGCRANELDAYAQTALFHAVESGSVECVEYLLNVGFSPDHVNSENRSPVHVAATLGFLPSLQLLQAYGADLNLASAHGATPMHEAAANGHSDSLEFLLQAGCHVNEAAGPTQSSALHYAVSAGHEGCVRVLLEYGAEINILAVTEEGEQLTPLDYVNESDFPEVAELLKANGATSGAEIVTQTAGETVPLAGTADTAEAGQADAVEGVAEEGTDKQRQVEAAKLDIPVRPPSPSKQSLERVLFESEDVPGMGEGSLGRDSPLAPRRPSAKSLDLEKLTPEDGEASVPLPPGPAKSQTMGRGATELEVKTAGGVPQTASGQRRPPGMLERALSVLKRSKSPPPDSILSSAVGFYAAQATMLAAALIGTPLGDKTMEVAQRVASDTAEDLKRAANEIEGDIPDLVWLKEAEPEPSPSPVVVEEPPTPSPSPSPPPPEIKEDPYERRLRKAKAQMDMSKSPGYRAVEELLKAQSTHMKLRRQFEEERLRKNLTEMKEAFEREEALAQEASNQIMKKFNDRIRKAETVSEQVNNAIDSQLDEAQKENDKIASLMGEMGVSPRPTISQWLKNKTEQKKVAVQDALIDWDRNKERREAAILLQQAVTSQRALQHAAWGARKDISAKLRALKLEMDTRATGDPGALSKLMFSRGFPSPPSYKKKERGVARKHVGKLMRPHRTPGSGPPPKIMSSKPRLHTSTHTPTSSYASVRATPQGFLNMRDSPRDVGVTPPTRGTSTTGEGGVGMAGPPRTAGKPEELWQLGEKYAQGKFSLPRPPSETYLRATGSKTVHADRTLHFLPPSQYRGGRTVDRHSPVDTPSLSQSYPRGGLRVRSIEFELGRDKMAAGRRRSHSGSTAQYHSLADSISGRSQLPQKHEVPVLSMKVLDAKNLPPTVVS